MRLIRKGLALTALILSSMGATVAIDPEQTTVLITGGKPENAAKLQALADADPNIVIEQLDVTDHARIEELATKYQDQPIDILINNAALTPRYATAFKRVKGVDFDTARLSFEVNALGPLKMSQQFMPHVAASEQKKIIVISSKGGSFAESPKMPMMYSYRGSKSALNMFMYTLSYETTKKDIILTILSPGMVNTTEDMKGMKLQPGTIEVNESVAKMLVVIDGLTSENNGQFLNYEEGRVVGW